MEYFFLLLMASVIGLTQGQADSSRESCMKLTHCGKGLAAHSRDDRVDEICKLTEAALACYHTNLQVCQMEAVVKLFRESMEQLEIKAKSRCTTQETEASNNKQEPEANDDNVPILVARFSPLRDEQRDCEQRFEACVTPEFLHASEHKNYTRLCNAASLVFSCAERVLEEWCHHVPNDTRDKLRSQINRLRRSVSPNCHDLAAPPTALSILLLIGCLLLSKLGLMQTSG